MKKIFFKIAVILLAINSATAQQKNIETSYQEYFKLPREAFFLHTNKTVYLTGEELWFKTYAFDRKNNLPSLKTTNIYLGLYDSIGNEIEKKLYLAKDGAAIGNFKIDTLLTSGSYYLKATTNWMKNFSDENAFVQKIEILNPKNKRNSVVNKTEFDLQFLPEGGHLISDVKNSVGFKFLNDEGKGSQISGNIFDKNNNIVTTFKSNVLGMGKFSLIPKPNEIYTAKFMILNNVEESVELPIAKDFGLAISVNNIKQDQTIVSLSTNPTSFDKFSSDSLKIVVHRDGLLKTIAFQMDKPTVVLSLSKKDLFHGINILTVFDSKDNPLVERIIFNDQSFNKLPLAISQKSSDFDSLNYSIRSIKPLKNSEIANLSVSVLPTGTKSYYPDHTIISSLLLAPYIQSNIENPSYYFNDFSIKDKYELDILLLTQGWSKYSWDKIKKGQLTPIYDFENGISINGGLNSSTKNLKSLIVYPTKYNKSGFINIDEKGKFNFKNSYLEKGEVVSFSAIMNNGRMKRPLVSLSPIIQMSKDKIEQKDLNENFISFFADKNNVPNNFITKGYEQLDEVLIKIKKKEKLRDPQFPNAEITQITKETATQYPTVIDFLRNNGFDVVDGNNGVALGQVTVTSRGRGGGASPVLFVDGALMQDFNILQTITTDKVDKILVDRSGIGLGISGGNAFGGVIKITTRNTSLLSPNLTSPDIFSIKATYGFEPVKEFYAPKYPSYQLQTFKDYGIIHWEPNMTITGSDSFEFRTINTNLDEITFYIEGISNEGNLFSQIIKLTK